MNEIILNISGVGGLVKLCLRKYVFEKIHLPFCSAWVPFWPNHIHLRSSCLTYRVLSQLSSSNSFSFSLIILPNERKNPGACFTTAAHSAIVPGQRRKTKQALTFITWGFIWNLREKLWISGALILVLDSCHDVSFMGQGILTIHMGVHDVSWKLKTSSSYMEIRNVCIVARKNVMYLAFQGRKQIYNVSLVGTGLSDQHLTGIPRFPHYPSLLLWLRADSNMGRRLSWKSPIL